MNYRTQVYHIDSSKVIGYYNSYGTSFYSKFDNVACEANECILYNFISCQIPHSFYQVNVNNSYLDINENNVVRTITMPYGNYSSSDYALTLVALLNYNNNAIQYSITYNKISNKFIIKTTTLNATATFLLLSGANSYRNISVFIGLPRTADVTISNVDTYTNMISMYDIYELRIKSDICNDEILTSDLTDKILVNIPISTQPYGIINYKDDNAMKYRIESTSITGIQIELTDNLNRSVDLNGMPFVINILLTIIKDNSKINDAREYQQRLLEYNNQKLLEATNKQNNLIQENIDKTEVIPKQISLMNTHQYKELQIIEKMLKKLKKKN